MSDETPDHEADKALAGEYALGLLSPDEAAAFEARLATDAQLRAAYADWAEDLARLTDRIEPVAPPPDSFGRIEARLFGPPRRPAGPVWRRWGLGVAVAAGLAVAVGLATGVLERGPIPPDTPSYQAELVAEDRSLVVSAAYDAGQGRLFVERQQGGPRAGRALELWVIAGEDAPVSLGVLPEAARADLDVPPALRGRLDGAVLAISDEPPGGSPTGVPTGDVLAAGPITKL